MAVIELNPAFTSAKGRLGRIVLYYRNGVQCARTHVVPRNPDTECQRQNRKTFADAVKSWQALSAEEKRSFNRKAMRKRMSGYNLFISQYMKSSCAGKEVITCPHINSIELHKSDPLRSVPVFHSMHPVSGKYTGYLQPAGQLYG
jgi:alpha-ketoglutarate-dependent taurine dioxygenase